MTEAASLGPGRYIMRQLRARPTRSALIVAGVAIAVAFFVLFASMSAGLSAFIDEELTRPRPVSIVLESGSPTPFDEDQAGLVALVALGSQRGSGVPHHVTTRVQLPVSSATDRPVWLWGVDVLEGGEVATPPYDPGAPLSWGRHLNASDMPLGAPLACVMGHRAMGALFPDLAEGSRASIGPDGTVDPWRTVDATDYPLSARDEATAWPRAPVRARAVGALAPGQGDLADWGIFVASPHLLSHLAQADGSGGFYHPQLVVTVEDGTRVDVDDLEDALVAAVPGVEGTDDAWEAEAFSAAYGGASSALDGWLTVVTAILVVLLVAGVSDTTLVAVTERRRELATLRAVGIGRREVSALVVREIAVLALLGLAVGTAAGVALALAFGHMHEVTGGEGIFLAPVSLSPWVLAGAASLALGSALLASAYPASRASRRSPTEALRYE